MNDRIRIEKALPIVTASPNILLQKVTLPLARGGYFFVFVFSIIFNNNVTTILSIISTMDKSSKSLIRIPSFRLISYIYKISATTEGKFPQQ